MVANTKKAFDGHHGPFRHIFLDKLKGLYERKK